MTASHVDTISRRTIASERVGGIFTEVVERRDDTGRRGHSGYVATLGANLCVVSDVDGTSFSGSVHVTPRDDRDDAPGRIIVRATTHTEGTELEIHGRSGELCGTLWLFGISVRDLAIAADLAVRAETDRDLATAAASRRNG